jgi:hypothetical protein
MGQTTGINSFSSNVKNLSKRVTAVLVILGVLANCVVITNTALASGANTSIETLSDKISIRFQGKDFFSPKIVFSRPPGDLPGQYLMNHVYPLCAGEKAYDCIMNVEFINKSGKSVSGKFLEYIPVAPKGNEGSGSYKGSNWEASAPPYYYPTTEEIIVKGNSKKKIPDGSRSSIWSFPGLSHSGGDKYLVSVQTYSAVTNYDAPSADNSIADWRDSTTSLTITPIKVDNDTSGLEVTREIFEKNADGKYSKTSSVDVLSNFGVSNNGNKVCYLGFEKDKPNCYSQAEDSEYPRFKITLRLKLTEDFLTVRHWFMARAAGIKVTSKKEPESSIVTFEGTTIMVPKATALLPATIEGYKIYRAATNKSYADSGVTNKQLDLNDLSGFDFWQSFKSKMMLDTDPGTIAFWSGIEPFATVLVEPRSPTWSFESANIPGSDVGSLWPCVKTPHISGVAASNASIMRPSPPTWNAEKQTLEFRIASPHLNQDGSVAEGFYNLAVSQEVANCLWGGDASKSRAEVSIISDAGEKKIFVSSTGSSDGYINFQVSGFTYSVNTISLKLLKNVVATPTKSSTQLKEITCKKGKVTKKFKAKKCPAGYVKK